MIQPLDAEDPNLLNLYRDLGRKDSSIDNLERGIGDLKSEVSKLMGTIHDVQNQVTRITTRMLTLSAACAGGATVIGQGLHMYLRYKGVIDSIGGGS